VSGPELTSGRSLLCCHYLVSSRSWASYATPYSSVSKAFVWMKTTWLESVTQSVTFASIY
jgi:hypothetical protein